MSLWTVVNVVNRSAAYLVDGLTALLKHAPPLVALLVHALLMALLALAVYALVSNRQRIKRTRDRTLALWDRVRELHPYEVPEFVVVPIVDGNDAYLRWIGESTRDAR